MHIYKITNQKNGKIYVGKKLGLFSDCLDYFGSGLLVKQAVEKYGKENFSKVLLEVCDSLESLNNREKYWIQTLDATIYESRGLIKA